MVQQPQACSIAEILDRLARSHAVRPCLAGSPKAMAASQGIAEILRRGSRKDISISGGLTLIPSAAAYTFPLFRATTSGKKVGMKSQFHAVVDRVTASDVTIESFYPAPGDHAFPGGTHREGSRVFHHYWKITREISELIQQGEQEHLDDAQRAFDLTVGKIAAVINSLAGRPFGPAASPQAAEGLAEAAFRQAIPIALGTDPRNWVKVLDKLLLQTKARDDQGWHSLMYDPETREGDRILREVTTTGKTKVGTVPSSRIVNY
jgi:hypothetical protein